MPPFRFSDWLTPSRKGFLCVFSGAACISFAGLFVKESPLEPGIVAFYRLLFGGLVLMVAALLRGERHVPSRPMARILFQAALCFGVELVSWHECIVRVGPGLATILANFQVFFLALWGTFVLGERLSPGHKLAIPMAIAGLMLLLEVNPANLPPHILAGLGFGLLTATIYAAYILVLQRSRTVRDKLPPVLNMGLITMGSMLFVGMYCLAHGDSFAIPDAYNLGLLALLGVGCQAAGWLLLAAGLPHMPASRAGLIMLTQPALGFTWDILFYSRPTGPVGFVGLAVTLLAIGMGLGGGKKSG
jgi:drug/metabolite transporter (DMT)-like permease